LADSSEQPLLEAQVLLAHALQKPRTWVIAHMDISLSSAQMEQLNGSLHRLVFGEPLPYIIGVQQFYGLEFIVSPQVLIPRPETELLVEESLRWLSEQEGKRRIVDVGTGSGCIAISIAKNVPGLFIVASDISAQALQVAQKNILLHHVEKDVQLLQASLLGPIHFQIDLLCANLPYIPAGKLKNLQVTKFEPMLALDGKESGFYWIEALLSQALNRMASPSLMLFELESTQEDMALHFAHLHFQTAHCQVLKDVAGLPRLLRVEIKKG
jgi:release factor glutamine methyltransferase